MTHEWAQLKAACLLGGTSINACAKKFRKTPKALYRALNEPKFSKGLRSKLITFTDTILSRPHINGQSRRAA